MKQNKLKCKKCGRNWKMLAGDTCFFCDPKHWDSYFEKLKGKGK